MQLHIVLYPLDHLIDLKLPEEKCKQTADYIVIFVIIRPVIPYHCIIKNHCNTIIK